VEEELKTLLHDLSAAGSPHDLPSRHDCRRVGWKTGIVPPHLQAGSWPGSYYYSDVGRAAVVVLVDILDLSALVNCGKGGRGKK